MERLKIPLKKSSRSCTVKCWWEPKRTAVAHEGPLWRWTGSETHLGTSDWIGSQQGSHPLYRSSRTGKFPLWCQQHSIWLPRSLPQLGMFSLRRCYGSVWVCCPLLEKLDWSLASKSKVCTVQEHCLPWWLNFKGKLVLLLLSIIEFLSLFDSFNFLIWIWLSYFFHTLLKLQTWLYLGCRWVIVDETLFLS